MVKYNSDQKLLNLQKNNKIKLTKELEFIKQKQREAHQQYDYNLHLLKELEEVDLIVGEQEEQDGTVSIRKQGEGDQGTITISEFISLLHTEINSTLEQF